MVDPTSDLGEDLTEAEAPTCERCGATILRDPDHRVVTWVEDDEVRTVHFCDEACRDEWETGKG